MPILFGELNVWNWRQATGYRRPWETHATLCVNTVVDIYAYVYFFRLTFAAPFRFSPSNFCFVRRRLAVAPMSHAMLRVRLGISEIDSYNMLFYSHYLRYNERAANSCLSPESSSAVLRRVVVAKYMSSVRWNDTVDIRTTAVAEPSAVEGEYTLLHEWFVAEQYEKAAYLSICTYSVSGSAGFTAARTPNAKEARRIQALQRQAGNVFTPQEQGGRSETLPVYPDMIGPGGSLAVPCVMDLFERQRTTLIGGQEELERLKAEDGTFIVVYMIQALELPPATVVRPREEIEVSTVRCHHRPPPPALPLVRAAWGQHLGTSASCPARAGLHSPGRRLVLLRQAERHPSADGAAVRGGLPHTGVCARRGSWQGPDGDPQSLRRRYN